MSETKCLTCGAVDGEHLDWCGMRVAERPSGVDVGRRLTVVDASSLALKAVEWLERDLIPAAALTIVPGMGGKGKSTLLATYAAMASRGRFEGKYSGQPVKVLWVGNEDGRDEVVGPRIRVAGADFDCIGFVDLDAENLGDDVNVVTDIDELRRKVEEHDAKVMMIDPVVEYLPGGTDSHNDLSVRQALRPLRNLAEELGVAVIGLVHLNKADTLDVAARIAGSAAFRNIARSVLVVGDYPEDDAWRVIFQNKSNYGPEHGRGHLYKIEGAQFTDLKDEPVFDDQGWRATTGQVVWGEWVELDPTSFPARETERGQPKRVRAVEMLTALLSDGPQLRSYVEEQAKLERVSWRTVETAKAEEGIEHRQFHWPDPGRNGPSWWGLPGTDWEAFRSAISCLPPDCGPEQALRTLIEQGDWPPAMSGPQSPRTDRDEIADPTSGADRPDDPDTAMTVAEITKALGATVITVAEMTPDCTCHTWARCNSCGEGHLIRTGTRPRCAITPGCEGHHEAAP
jgi:AAA domain